MNFDEKKPPGPSRFPLPPPARVWIPDLLRCYGGFLLGALTLPLTFITFRDFLTAAAFALRLDPALFPDAANPWAETLVNNLLYGFFVSAFMLGGYAFLGGLWGGHSLGAGLAISAVTMLAILLVGYVYEGMPNLDRRGWLAAALTTAHLGNLLGVIVPYLAGFSARRLALLLFLPAGRRAR
ncbi:MAG: hypothetical protein AAGK14_15755 [Verrucomicrobiota bacterium]